MSIRNQFEVCSLKTVHVATTLFNLEVLFGKGGFSQVKLPNSLPGRMNSLSKRTPDASALSSPLLSSPLPWPGLLSDSK